MKSKGVIAAGHIETARAGRAALEAGGNAFDAAVAAFFAACVAETVLTSPGGGGFLLAHTPSEEVLYDFFTQTPRNSLLRELNFYPVEADFGATKQEFHIGIGACATPGAIRGIFEVHANHCTLPMKVLIEPALKLGREGVAVDGFLPYLYKVVEQIYLATPGSVEIFQSKRNPPKVVGEEDVLKQYELADFFETLAAEGPDFFYLGEVAHTIVGECNERGGQLTLEDFAKYKVEKRHPLIVRYNEAKILTNPLPSLGGTLIGLALKLLEEDRVYQHSFGSLPHLDILARSMELTGDVKQKHCGYESLESGAVKELMDPRLYADFQKIVSRHALSTQGTTHISVIDVEGNVAALTVSNGSGSGFIVPGCGFMLNNMLGEEDLNRRGFHRWEPNTRIASMMSPSIIFNGKGIIATGSGGSNRIRSAILQVMLNCIDFDMRVEDSVKSPRIHFENGLLNIEDGFPREVIDSLENQYASLKLWPDRSLFFGGAHTAYRLHTGELGGAGDPRRGGVCFLVP